jgi:hypothetical protein
MLTLQGCCGGYTCVLAAQVMHLHTFLARGSCVKSRKNRLTMHCIQDYALTEPFLDIGCLGNLQACVSCNT